MSGVWPIRTDEPDGRLLWDAGGDRLARASLERRFDTAAFGTPQIIAPRPGQGGFRVRIIDAYDQWHNDHCHLG